AVAGDLEVVRRRERGDPAPLRDAAAAADVDLQAVHRPGTDHAGEVRQVVAVLTCRDIGLDAVADPAEPVEVVGADRLLEPGDVGLGGSQPRDGLLGRVGPVGVHEEIGPRTDGRTGQPGAGGVAPGVRAAALAAL